MWKPGSVSVPCRGVKKRNAVQGPLQEHTAGSVPKADGLLYAQPEVLKSTCSLVKNTPISIQTLVRLAETEGS